MKSYLDQFYSNAKGENFKARGFKLMYYQTFYTPGLLSYLKNNNVKVILLLRENILRNALSDIRARSTGIYHNQSNTQARLLGLPKLQVNTTTLSDKMQHILHQNDKLISLVKDMDYLKVRYEDFVDWDNTMNRISAFLNVSPETVSAGAIKLNPNNLDEMIENFGEVTQWLKQNNYAEFIN